MKIFYNIINFFHKLLLKLTGKSVVEEIKEITSSVALMEHLVQEISFDFYYDNFDADFVIIKDLEEKNKQYKIKIKQKINSEYLFELAEEFFSGKLLSTIPREHIKIFIKKHEHAFCCLSKENILSLITQLYNQNIILLLKKAFPQLSIKEILYYISSESYKVVSDDEVLALNKGKVDSFFRSTYELPLPFSVFNKQIFLPFFTENSVVDGLQYVHELLSSCIARDDIVETIKLNSVYVEQIPAKRPLIINIEKEQSTFSKFFNKIFRTAPPKDYLKEHLIKVEKKRNDLVSARREKQIKILEHDNYIKALHEAAEKNSPGIRERELKEIKEKIVREDTLEREKIVREYSLSSNLSYLKKSLTNSSNFSQLKKSLTNLRKSFDETIGDTQVNDTPVKEIFIVNSNSLPISAEEILKENSILPTDNETLILESLKAPYIMKFLNKFSNKKKYDLSIYTKAIKKEAQKFIHTERIKASDKKLKHEIQQFFQEWGIKENFKEKFLNLVTKDFKILRLLPRVARFNYYTTVMTTSVVIEHFYIRFSNELNWEALLNFLTPNQYISDTILKLKTKFFDLGNYISTNYFNSEDLESKLFEFAKTFIDYFTLDLVEAQLRTTFFIGTLTSEGESAANYTTYITPYGTQENALHGNIFHHTPDYYNVQNPTEVLVVNDLGEGGWFENLNNGLNRSNTNNILNSINPENYLNRSSHFPNRSNNNNNYNNNNNNSNKNTPTVENPPDEYSVEDFVEIPKRADNVFSQSHSVFFDCFENYLLFLLILLLVLGLLAEPLNNFYNYLKKKTN